MGKDFNMKIYNLKQIETPRLIIRPVQLGDEIAVNKAIINTLEILQKWQPWAKDPSLATTLNFVQSGVFAWDSRCINNFPMVVIHKQDQKIIGASGFNDHSNVTQGIYETGYWCDKDYQGHGYVTEFTNALTRYAIEELKASRVVISMLVENKKSVAVATRLNYTLEGIKTREVEDRIKNNEEQNYVYSLNGLDNLPFLDVSWINYDDISPESKALIWAKKILDIKDEKVFAKSLCLKKTPWANVYKLNDRSNFIYLKQTPKLLAIEADILKILDKNYHVPVPKIINYNQELNCFLMEDCGTVLREILKKEFDIELVAKAIDQFTSMQIKLSNKIDSFLKIGVPDWRLDKLHDLFKQLLSQKDILSKAGLSLEEIIQLENILPEINLLIKKLSQYGIKESIVQPDFHDNNILIDNKNHKITFIDLGEITISHPFFSLLICLEQLKKHYNLSNESSNYSYLKDVCLNNFLQFESLENLKDAWDLGEKLVLVYEVLCQYRLMRACDIDKILLYQSGKFKKQLQKLIVII